MSPGTAGVQMRADLAKGVVDLTDPASAVTRNVPFPVSQVQTSGNPVVVGSNIVLVLDAPGSDSLVPDGSALRDELVVRRVALDRGGVTP